MPLSNTQAAVAFESIVTQPLDRSIEGGLMAAAFAMLFGPAVAPYIMASEAGGQMANSITQRGGSSGEAFLGGAATAIIEYLTERISIGKLFDTAETAGKFFTKETFVNMLQNAEVNMSEEWTAEVFETLSDYAIMGDRSEIGMRMAGLIESGMSPGEAMNQAFNEFLVYKPLEAAASGALQGFLLSGGSSAVGRLLTNTQYGQQNVQDTEATEGMRGNPDIDNKEGIGDNESTGIYEPDIIIGRSVGVKAINYDIFAPNGEIFNLAEGTHIKNVEVIAGCGRNRRIDIVDYLVDKYGGEDLKWRKCKGMGYVDVDGENLLAELHWYEEPSVGRVEFKIKPQIGGELFIYED